MATFDSLFTGQTLDRTQGQINMLNEGQRRKRESQMDDIIWSRNNKNPHRYIDPMERNALADMDPTEFTNTAAKAKAHRSQYNKYYNPANFKKPYTPQNNTPQTYGGLRGADGLLGGTPPGYGMMMNHNVRLGPGANKFGFQAGRPYQDYFSGIKAQPNSNSGTQAREFGVPAGQQYPNYFSDMQRARQMNFNAQKYRLNASKYQF